MLAKTGGGAYNFYDTKNLYGWSESRATVCLLFIDFDNEHCQIVLQANALKQATGQRGAVISRYQFRLHCN
jgi:hypothetical protein